MYSVETTKDGKIFHPLFIDGRLRTYSNLNNARNGARQLLKNPKNQYSMIRIINKEDVGAFAVYVRKTDTGYEEDICDRNKPEQAFTNHKLNSILPENLNTPIEIKVEKKVEVIKVETPLVKNEPKVENKTEVKNKIPLESLVEKPKTDIVKISATNDKNTETDKEKRIQSLKEAHDKWKMKKENPSDIKTGDSLNNLADNHSVKQVNDIYAGLMEGMIDDAISQNNPCKLFKLEFMLSQGGYSWYYKDNNIHVDTTENVVNMLKDLELILDD